MNKKILHLLICFLLFLPSFSAVGISNILLNEKRSSDEIIENEPIECKNGNMSIFLKPKLCFYGVKIIIKNCGNEPLTEINWNLNTSGGKFIRGGMGSGVKNIIKPNRRVVIHLLPIPLIRSSSPVGIGRVEIEATAEASNGEFARTTAEAIVISLKTIFLKDQGNTVKYKVTFNATWSEDNHPDYVQLYRVYKSSILE